MSIIEFREVSKFFGDFQVLEDLDFSIDEGEVVVVIPEHFFENPENERPKRFLNQILH